MPFKNLRTWQQASASDSSFRSRHYCGKARPLSSSWLHSPDINLAFSRSIASWICVFLHRCRVVQRVTVVRKSQSVFQTPAFGPRLRVRKPRSVEESISKVNKYLGAGLRCTQLAGDQGSQQGKDEIREKTWEWKSTAGEFLSCSCRRDSYYAARYFSANSWDRMGDSSNS